MKTSLKAIACMVALAVLVTVQSAAAKGKLEGVWKITEVNISGSKPITGTNPSLMIFTKKHFSFMAVTGNKPRSDLPQKEATDAQKAAAWGPFMAIAGKYEVKGTTIVIHPEVGKDPQSEKPNNSFPPADFKIEGNTLSLKVKFPARENPITLKLTRVE
jgi:hypothetical protein